MVESLPAILRRSIVARETDCTKNIEPSPGRIFFRDLAEFIFPIKTAHQLAARTGASLRMCRYWLSCEHEVPGVALRVLLAEIIRRLD